jgi:hypothetical protein
MPSNLFWFRSSFSFRSRRSEHIVHVSETSSFQCRLMSSFRAASLLRSLSANIFLTWWMPQRKKINALCTQPLVLCCEFGSNLVEGTLGWLSSEYPCATSVFLVNAINACAFALLSLDGAVLIHCRAIECICGGATLIEDRHLLVVPWTLNHVWLQGAHMQCSVAGCSEGTELAYQTFWPIKSMPYGQLVNYIPPPPPKKVALNLCNFEEFWSIPQFLKFVWETDTRTTMCNEWPM